MAISGGDGSIILTTSVDTSGISKGSVSIRSALQSVDTTVKKVQNSFSAFREQKVTLATLNQAIKDQQYVLNSLNLEYAEYVARGKASSTQAKELKANIDAATVEMREMQVAAATLGAKGSASITRLGVAMRSILSYFIGIQTIFKVINFSSEAAQFAIQTEASVQRLVDIYGEAAQSVGDFIDANARAIGMSRSAGASIASTYGNLLSVWADQKTNAELTNSLLNQTAVVASKTGRTTTDVAERIRSGLLGNTEAIEDLGINVNIKTTEITDAFKRIADGRSWEQLNAYEQSQVRTLTILEQSTKKYGTTVADTSATVRNQYQAAYEDFKNTWGQVVNTVLIPVLKILTQVFTIATKGLQVIAGLSGKTVENFNQEKEYTEKTRKNIEEQRKEQEKLNKSVKKGHASFDEIDILSKETAESSSNTGGANIPITSGSGESYNNSFVDKISGDMAAIMGIVGGALVAVGLLLIFFGHPFWGIGFIIAGASVFAVSMATVSSSDEVTPISEKLMAIMAIAGIALTAIGLILLFKGSWKWGIGFIIAGASALSVAIVAVKSGNATKEAENMLLDIMLIAGSALLALGIILLLAGQITPLSIGLVVAGAGSLAGAIAINQKAVGEKIKKFFQDNAWLIAGVSLALLVIGVLLCFAQIWGLGIGLIAAGAAGLVTEVVLNWNTIKEKVSSAFNAVISWVKTWGLLVLGIILTLTGNPFLGIPLIVKGAKSLTEAQNPTWLAILDKLKEVWGKIKAFWNANIAPIFTAKWWADLGKKAINGLLGVIEIGLNWIIDKINVFIGGLSEIVGKVGDVIGVDWSIPKIPRVKIPRLAQGAVIPPNREFLAVLGDQKNGTNIEAPLQTIVDAFNIALSQNGGASGGNTEVVLEIDGREFGRAVVEQGNKENRRIGTKLVIA